ncbi:MAG TPA: BTAD domain-containing putative transcriptional regulator [Burkholderiales bacterium]|nr:BTAD domain-containing putative transcriptional regulator [Burkholderiales bacterium]
MQRPDAAAPAFLAKLARPRYTQVLPRERLFRLLDEHRERVLWITAPPGAGKTTLASSYVAQRGLPHLWYQLDAADCDPATFFHYLGVAVAALPRPGADQPLAALPHLTPEYLGGLPVFARRYFEAIAWRLETPFALVLDNYHEVAEGAALHAVLRDGLAALPSGFVTIVLSRTPPPPELARLVANGEVGLVGWEDLQLTLEEVKGIERLRKRDRRGFASAEELHRRTQGWAAGLMLLLEQTVPDGAARPLADSNAQALFDYFAGEIFSGLAADTQRLLLTSALLPKPTAAMLAELSGSAKAADVLDELYRKNYFTLKHPGAEPAYEYHPLFREFLASRARGAFGPAELKALQKTAAQLLLAHGQVENAAELLRAAGDFAALAALIRTQALGLIEQGRGQVVERWLAHLPAEVRRADAWLCCWHGFCRLPFNPAEARGHFEQAYQLFAAAQDLAGRCTAWCAVVDSFVFDWGNFTPLEPWIGEMESLRREHPELPSAALTAQVDCGMFVALMYLQPQHPAMPALEARVRDIILHGGDARLQVKFGNHLLIYYTWWIGDLAKAELLVDTLRAQVQQPGVPPLVQITWYVMAAAYYWMSAANEECIACVDRGLDLGRSSGVHTWDMLLCSQGHFASLSSDRRALAADYLRRMEMKLNMSRPLDTAMYYYHSAWHRLAHDNFAGAKEFAETALRMAEAAGARFPAAVMRNDLGRVLHYLGERAESVAHIQRARAEGQAMKAQTIEYLTLLAQAEAALADGDQETCVANLRAALAVGRVQQFRNHTWWSPRVMSALYAKALEHGIEVDYVSSVIAQRRLLPPEIVPDNWPWAVRIRTLGEFALLHGKEPIECGGKPLELLQALVALGARNVHQSALIDALWPELDGDKAQQAFETALYRLRKLLGEQSIVLLKEGRLTLDRSHTWLDTAQFDDTVLDIEEHLAACAPAAKLDALEQDLHALYAGPFLPGETAAWAVAARTRLRRRFLQVVEQLGGHYEAAADWTRALSCYRKGLDAEPIAESLYLRVMCCHRSLGQPGEVLAVYSRCRDTLSSLLGVGPSREIEDIAGSLRRQTR